MGNDPTTTSPPAAGEHSHRRKPRYLRRGEVEAPVGLVALLIALVTLTHTTDGVSPAVLSGVIALAVAVILAWGAGLHRLRGLHDLTWASALAISMVVTALILSLLSFHDARNRQQLASTKDEIRTAILGSYQAELAWYKHPASANSRGNAEPYFVGVSDGGERLVALHAAIHHLVSCGRRMGATSTGTTFIKWIQVSPDGRDAAADTIQTLFQSVEHREGSRWVAVPLPPEDTNLDSVDQLYVMRKLDDRWRVASEPQKQNTTPC